MISRILNRMISYEGGTIPNMEQEEGEDDGHGGKKKVMKRKKVSLSLLPHFVFIMFQIQFEETMLPHFVFIMFQIQFEETKLPCVVNDIRVCFCKFLM